MCLTLTQHSHILTAACSAVARECVTLSAGALERSGCADANVLTVMIACRAQVRHNVYHECNTHTHTGWGKEGLARRELLYVKVGTQENQCVLTIRCARNEQQIFKTHRNMSETQALQDSRKFYRTGSQPFKFRNCVNDDN